MTTEKDFMRFSLIFILFLLFSTQGFATTVRCSNLEYAGKELVFYTPSDPISRENEMCFKLTFNTRGEAQAEVKITHTIYTFCDFGIYRGMLYLEPQATIVLKLPPFREKSFANQKNPYFSPVAFWFVSESKNTLNDKASNYEQKLNQLVDKNFDKLYFNQSKTVWDSIKAELKTSFPEEKSETFANQRNLKEQLVEADVFRMRPEDFSSIFSNIQPDFWNHQAFIELFNKTFDQQLSFSVKNIKDKNVKTAVEARNTTSLLNFVKNKYKVTGKMAELVLLKLLHDGYYSGDFSKKAILDMVSSDFYAKNSNPVIKKAADNIHTKFIFLQKGSAAPVICLNDLDGKKACTNQNDDKFKYVIFADVETVVCQEHLKYLSRVNELFNKHLDIYVVLRDTDQKGIDKFFNEHEVPAEKMIDKEGNISKQYKIRSYPQCFLFDEQHKVVFENTKAPLDGFEEQFGTWLRNELFMRQRNQSR